MAQVRRFRRAVTALLVLVTGAATLTGAPAIAQDQPPGAELDTVVDDATHARFIVGLRRGSEARRRDADVARRAERAAARSVRTTVRLVGRTVDQAAVVETGRALDDEESRAFLAALVEEGDVTYAEAERRFTHTALPNDPQLGQLWHYTDQTVGIQWPDAREVATGAGVVVAVLDTGIVTHPDLDSKVVGGYDFVSRAGDARDGDGRDADFSDEGDWTSGECGPPRDSSWHGSHVAGTAAASTDDGVGIAGVAEDAGLLVVRVLAKCGGTTWDIADAMVWAAGGNVSGVPSNPNPAKVLNLSLGGSGGCGSTFQNAIDDARALGAVVVVSAGNSNQDAITQAPANCDGVVTVAATGLDGAKAWYSNFGAVVDLAAPGGGAGDGVRSSIDSGATTPQGPTWADYYGTSMAAPHVAGVAAMLLEADPGLTPSEVEAALEASARPFPGTCVACGAGLLSAFDALDHIGATDPPQGEVLWFENLKVRAIPDGTDGLWRNVWVPAGLSRPDTVLVEVDIDHPRRGDLDIYLRSHNRRRVILKAKDPSDTAADVKETFTASLDDLRTYKMEGRWQLVVRDRVTGEAGTLNGWRLGVPQP